jgi:hypothetical protein
MCSAQHLTLPASYQPYAHYSLFIQGPPTPDPESSGAVCQAGDIAENNSCDVDLFVNLAGKKYLVINHTLL